MLDGVASQVCRVSASRRSRPMVGVNLPRWQSELRKGNEGYAVAGSYLRHILRYVDQAVGDAQPGDEAGAVAGEFLDAKPVRGFAQHPPPEFSPSRFAIRKIEQRREPV